jgi:hypothetical protein
MQSCPYAVLAANSELAVIASTTNMRRFMWNPHVEERSRRSIRSVSKAVNRGG